MRTNPAHHPFKERFNEPSIIFLTVCAKNRKTLFAKTDVAEILVDAWRQASEWSVGRYMIMPDHIHLFCAPAKASSHPLASWIRFWKSQVSNSWPRPAERPIWQLDHWDTQLRSISHYDEKWAYIELNPVRAGLVKDAADWPYQGTLNDLCW